MAAENPIQAIGCDRYRHVASMRPRRMAAENSSAAHAGRPRGVGFNEAAAHGRGKRCKD